MPNADKCFLLIPYKEYLKGIRVNSDGTIDQTSLTTAADQEFENYKAIERRINDPDCTGGGCCSAIFSGRGSGSAIGSSSSATVSTASTNAGDISPAGMGSTLAAGAWSVTGHAICDPTGTPAVGGFIDISNIPTVTTTQGGGITGRSYSNGTTANIDVPFSGLVVMDSPWSPDLLVQNSTSVSITPLAVLFSAFRLCDPCDYDVNPGGG